jgi:hypothetical protein
MVKLGENDAALFVGGSEEAMHHYLSRLEYFP